MTDRPFARLAREARRWLSAGGADATALATRARDATAKVPEARKGDWERLLDGFAREEPEKKRRARVEGLVRACALFEDSEPLAWEDEIDRLPGIGPTGKRELATRGVRTVADLVWTLPSGWDDLRAPLSVAEATRLAREHEERRTGRVVIAAAVRAAGMVPMRGRRAVRLSLADDLEDPKSAKLTAWWFFTAHGVLSVAKPGARVLLVGRVRVPDRGGPLVAHPDLVLDDPDARAVRPRYARMGIAPATLRKTIGAAARRVAPAPDPVPPEIVHREAMRPADEVLRAVHHGMPTPDEWRAAVERLAWVEGFALVWARLRSRATEEGRAPALRKDAEVHARFVAELGFAPTGAQKRAIRAVASDLAETRPMRRLLLGDVGTGKTAVALAAAAQCVAAGHQAAILVPTAILAEQYLDAAAPLARATGASVALLAAGMSAEARRRTLERVMRGDIGVVVGTHALLAEDVRFAKLGLVVVDEQHRLGVGQRLSLVQKGRAPHLLTLSATPIPRTLALALRGELATSVLDERPRGRPPVEVAIAGRGSFAEILEQMRAVCTRGERAFFVAPRIDDDEEDEDETSGVIARAAELSKLLAPAKVALVHGAMRADEKRRAMQAFRAGDAQVLVGTTVVEVGIDVPEATLMVVDGAERFGLAQLHQLRGRVGRGARPGRCVLMHDPDAGELARRRLEAVKGATDGAAIAKADLALRGPGDLGGTRQSGAEGELVWLDLAEPPAWAPRLEPDARAILARDPELALPEHRALALALRRHEGELAVREEAG